MDYDHDLSTEHSAGEGYSGDWKGWSDYYDNFLVCKVATKFAGVDVIDTTALGGIKFQLCEVSTPVFQLEGSW